MTPHWLKMGSSGSHMSSSMAKVPTMAEPTDRTGKVPLTVLETEHERAARCSQEIPDMTASGRAPTKHRSAFCSDSLNSTSHVLSLCGDSLISTNHGISLRGDSLISTGHGLSVRGDSLTSKGHGLSVRGDSLMSTGHGLSVRGDSLIATNHGPSWGTDTWLSGRRPPGRWQSGCWLPLPLAAGR